MIHYAGIDVSEPTRGHGSCAATEPEPNRFTPLTHIPAPGFHYLIYISTVWFSKRKIKNLTFESLICIGWQLVLVNRRAQFALNTRQLFFNNHTVNMQISIVHRL